MKYSNRPSREEYEHIVQTVEGTGAQYYIFLLRGRLIEPCPQLNHNSTH